MFLAIQNLAEAATVDCAAAGTTAADLVDRRPWRRLLTPNAADLVVHLHWSGAAQVIAAVILHRVPWSSSAAAIQVRVALGVWPWDEGAVIAEKTLPGVTAFQVNPAVPDPEDLERQVMALWTRNENGVVVPDPVAGVEAVRLELTGGAAAGLDEWALPYAWISELHQVAGTHPDDAYHSETEDADAHRNRRGQDLRVPFMNAEEYMEWLNAMERVGTTEPFLFIPRPTLGASVDRRSEGGLFKRTEKSRRVRSSVFMRRNGLDDGFALEKLQIERW